MSKEKGTVLAVYLPRIGDVIKSPKFVLGHYCDSDATESEKNFFPYDPSRGEAEFVVIAANLQGGGMKGYEIIPDGWHIQACRLEKDGRFNPKGEIIRFYVTGPFPYMINPADVKIVRRMKV